MPHPLPTVTLIGADHRYSRLKKVFNICGYYFDFADKKIITNMDQIVIDETDGIKIFRHDINSIEEYSRFMIKDLNTYVDTEHVLIVQHDGFILNPDAWTNDFLQYDYIGAPWWYNDENNVGNGGFSLRSKKLLEILSNDSEITDFHPEDDRICRKYGEYLRAKWIKFAPEEVARIFAIEWSLDMVTYPVKYGSTWTNEFGFHGPETDISNWKDWNVFFKEKYESPK